VSTQRFTPEFKEEAVQQVVERGYGTDITTPLGGVRQSGNGSDRSLHAFEKYENYKATRIQL
jgi:transposase-like protein